MTNPDPTAGKADAPATGLSAPAKGPPAPKPEREQTDKSLKSERINSDRVSAGIRAEIKVSADEIVERARKHADEVLEVARVKADDKLDLARERGDHSSPPGAMRSGIVSERAREDAVIMTERAAADEDLRIERNSVPDLTALLPIEREKTDRYLMTERTRSDDALAHRDDFLGMVSHDLRNLLHGIVVNATVVAEQASPTDEGRRVVVGMERIQRYVTRMNRLIGDLVDVVSIDAGKLALKRERQDAAGLVTETIDAFALAATNKGVKLDCKLFEGALFADFDHQRMLQVLANLLSNALKFTPSGGVITVCSKLVKGEVHLSVSDTGPGIEKQMLEVVFERFWQVGKDDRRGLGLGLYISRWIVDAHGGRIWAESTLGSGSAFTLALPLTKPPQVGEQISHTVTKA